MSNFYQDDGESGSPKICLATTAYDDPSTAYTFSIQRSRELLHKEGFKTAYFLLSGNCHVDDARNSIVRSFLESDCTELVFLDADVSWEPASLLKLCQIDKDVVGGVYPYRRENEKSEAMPVSFIPEKQVENGLLEVGGLPTGFLKIKRHVIESIEKDANKFTDNHGDKIPVIFERIFMDGKRYGGDIAFCKKWAAKGGKLYAAVDLTLGHTAKSVIRDSLSAYLRRTNRNTLRHLVSQVRTEGFVPEAFSEARKYIGNKWGAEEDVLSLCSLMGRNADGPIIEAGSGLTSIVLAASTKEPVFCLEHSQMWAYSLQDLIEQSGVSNIHVALCPIKDGWYDISKANLPHEFALGLNDGPPRTMASRMGFFDYFGDTKDIICDDADNSSYVAELSKWCNATGRRLDIIQRAAVIRSIQ